MVRIINYKERLKEDGTSFYVLELQGGIDMVMSQTTGNFYATAKRAFIPSTFDEQTCSALIGTEMKGCIIKEECEPFAYTVKETGEEIILSHRWVYSQEENTVKPKEVQTPKAIEKFQPKVEQFSQNGVLEYAQ
ncbi:hypothetical protein [Kordia sp.]|uniref:hypothetical protein n=1 Tax=Kordia sp. TaxID=1965332 RepID=UPI003B592898